MRKLLPAVAIIAFAYIAVSCGGGSESGKPVIGVEGGVVTSDDGKLAIDIPAGALDDETEITISAVSVDELPEALREVSGSGPAYRLEPDDLVFNEPVPVTLTLNRSELDNVPEDGVVAQLLLTQDADGEIETLDELVTEATLGEETVAVRGELSHFTFITKSDGALEISLERVKPRQLIGVRFPALVIIRNISLRTAGFGFDIEPIYFNSFGVPAVNTGRDVGVADTVSYGGLSGRSVVEYVCAASGTGQYGIDTSWRVVRSTPDSELYRSFSVTIRGKVDCVTTLATSTSTDTPEPGVATPTPPPTDTPEPEVPTSPPQSKPTAESVPTSPPQSKPTAEDVPTDTPVPTNTPEPVDDAARITMVSVGPNADASMTNVIVRLAGDPSKSVTHFLFRVRVMLGAQVGLIEFRDGIDHSVAPAGGSYHVIGDGVSFVFAKPVPTCVQFLVETFHKELANSNPGSDTDTFRLTGSDC